MKEIKKCIIIGLGEQSEEELVPTLIKNKNLYNVVAICDISIHSLKKALLLFPNTRIYTSYKECLNNESNIDIAFLSLPHYLYFDITMECLNNNINVIKEKPLCLNLNEAKVIFDKSIQKNKKVYTVTKRNFYPSYIKAKELLHLLGTVYQYTAKHYVTGGNIHIGWKSSFKEAGGGVTINLAYHLIDQLISLFGPVQSGYMHSSNIGNQKKYYEVEDSATTLLLHENNIYGSFQYNCYTGVKEESIEIHGNKAKLVVTKTSINLFSLEGKRLISITYDNKNILAYEKALFEYNNLTTQSYKKHIIQHVSIIETIDTLYKSKSKVDDNE